MFNRSSILLCIFFFLAAFGTLILKVHVQNLATDVKKIEAKRNKLSNAIQVLKAEWSYLNNAERVSKLAKRHLGLDQAKIKQVKYIKKKSLKAAQIYEDSTHVRQVNINWKYKSRIGILKISNKKSTRLGRKK